MRKNTIKLGLLTLTFVIISVRPLMSQSKVTVTPYKLTEGITPDVKDLGIIDGKHTFLTFSGIGTFKYKGKKAKGSKPLLIQSKDGRIENGNIVDLSATGVVSNYRAGSFFNIEEASNGDYYADYIGDKKLFFFNRVYGKNKEGDKGAFITLGIVDFNGKIVEELNKEYFYDKNTLECPVIISGNKERIAICNIKKREKKSKTIEIEVILYNNKLEEIEKSTFKLDDLFEDYFIKELNLTNGGKVLVHLSTLKVPKNEREQSIIMDTKNGEISRNRFETKIRVFSLDVELNEQYEIDIYKFSTHDNIWLNFDFFSANGKEGWAGFTADKVEGQFKMNGFYVAFYDEDNLELDTIYYNKNKKTLEQLTSWVKNYGVDGFGNNDLYRLDEVYFHEELNQYYFTIEKNYLKEVCTNNNGRTTCRYTEVVENNLLLKLDLNSDELYSGAFKQESEYPLTGFNEIPYFGVQIAKSINGTPYFIVYENSFRKKQGVYLLKFDSEGNFSKKLIFSYSDMKGKYFHIGTLATVDNGVLRYYTAKKKKFNEVQVKLPK